MEQTEGKLLALQCILYASCSYPEIPLRLKLRKGYPVTSYTWILGDLLFCVGRQQKDSNTKQWGLDSLSSPLIPFPLLSIIPELEQRASGSSVATPCPSKGMVQSWIAIRALQVTSLSLLHSQLLPTEPLHTCRYGP